MKKIKLFAFFAATAVANAASIDHIMNYTPEYNGNPALQGAISEMSSVNYNPAGLVRLNNGLYLNLGGQVAVGGYDTEFLNKKYKTDLLSAVPNLSLVKKEDKVAYFFTFGGIAGGASVDYEDGISKYGTLQAVLRQKGIQGILGSSAAALDQLVNTTGAEILGKVSGENRYLQATLGGAYEIDPQWSLSGGLRVVHGQRNFNGTLILGGLKNNIPVLDAAGILNGTAIADIERTAWGLGGQVGLNYVANDRLNLGLRYDSKVKMNFKTKGTNTTTIGGQPIMGNPIPALGFEVFYPEYGNGFEGRRDLPAILAFGGALKVTDELNTYAGVNYYFNRAANIDEKAEVPTGAKATYKDGYEFSLGAEYALNEKYTVLGGLNYAVTGAKAENFHDSEFALDSFMIGTGLKYQHTPDLSFVGTVNHYFYETASTNNVTFRKETSAIGLGATYKFD